MPPPPEEEKGAGGNSETKRFLAVIVPFRRGASATNQICTVSPGWQQILSLFPHAEMRSPRCVWFVGFGSRDDVQEDAFYPLTLDVNTFE